MTGARGALLAGLPLSERRVVCAGVPTAVLEAGSGPVVLLLHGPGESALSWRWVIPELARTHRVVAPDLPAHGSSGSGDRPLDADVVLGWLAELIERTCPVPPVVVGHVLGGAIAARFAVRNGGRIESLVLVDSLGLGRFHPSPRFAMGLVGFMARPTERSYDRFMQQCAYDADDVRRRMAEDWDAFVQYNVELARSEQSSAAGRLFRRVGLPRIPAADLARIDVPTTLIWGRHDRANKLRVAERASARFGWPLHVVDDVADDPARDRPEAFLAALRLALR